MLLLAALLLAAPAAAEWQKSGSSSRFDHYVDLVTRRSAGNLVRIWVMNDYYAAETNSAGKRYGSDKLLIEYDCPGERMRILAYAEYSGRMGSGETVGSRDMAGDWRAIIPGSVGQTRHRYACADAPGVATPSTPDGRIADVEIVNRSAEKIYGIYVSPVASRNWGEDRLGDGVLDPGQRFLVRLPRDGVCRYDIRVLYGGRRVEERGNQDLCGLTDLAFDGSSQRSLPAGGAGPSASSPRPSAPSPAPSRSPSFGTGFFISPQGLALTNDHVAGDCRSVVVRLEGRELPAQVVRRDTRNDLALLRVASREAVPFASFRSGASVRVGEGVVVAGFPLPEVLQNGINVTIGNVSAMAGLGGNSGLMQITAPVQPGNSGGPLLDMAGNVIGVVVSKLDATRVAQATGDIPQNINFAVHGTLARLFLESGGDRIVERPSDKDLRVVDVSDRARRYTVQVECRP